MELYTLHHSSLLNWNPLWTICCTKGTSQFLIWLITCALGYLFSWETKDRNNIPNHVAKWISSYAYEASHDVRKYIDVRCGITKCISLFISFLFRLLFLESLDDSHLVLSFVLLKFFLVLIRINCVNVGTSLIYLSGTWGALNEIVNVLEYRLKMSQCHSRCSGLLQFNYYFYYGH